MDLLIEFGPLMARGAKVTILLALASALLATLLGALGAWAKLSGGMIGGWVAGAYTTLVRGVPELVMIMLIYFGGQRLINDFAGALGLSGMEISKFGAGVFSLGFIFGAYLTETFRGAYLAIPPGQVEAARAYGLPGGRMLTRIIGPQLLRFALPGYANVWQVLLKGTAVVSVIGLQDLVGLADKAGKASREPFLFFTIVIFVYLAMTSASGWGFRAMERRTARGS